MSGKLRIWRGFDRGGAIFGSVRAKTIFKSNNRRFEVACRERESVIPDVSCKLLIV